MLEQPEEALRAEESITELLGELTGEMMAEILSKEASFGQSVIGFAVQCTQVIILKYIIYIYVTVEIAIQ